LFIYVPVIFAINPPYSLACLSNNLAAVYLKITGRKVFSQASLLI